MTEQERPARRQSPNAVSDRLSAVIERYRAAGRGLPGRRLPDGALAINTYHLGRLAGGQISEGVTRHRQILETSRLPVDDDCYLFAPVTATIDGVAWRTRPITWDEVPELARLLVAACYLVIGYLSGQRLGETLNLRRGCIEHDATSGLILLRGRYFKEARDPAGNKIPQGVTRPDPWVVVAPVATAVTVMQRLHSNELLFPRTLEIDGRADGAARSRHGRSRNDTLITRDIGIFCAWVNRYCAATGRGDSIPPDPNGTLHPARLRRTLAWFIARKPRGLVAAAIQYGHVSVAMTLGYSGSYASGFPDDLAFEQWLAKLETMAEDHERLQQGEHVSGPAAATYRQRVNAATRFAGRVLRTNREATALLADPDLQIYQGTGMTCVLDPHKAACRIARDERDHRRTPDLDDCRPHCGNIARTDRDIATLRTHVELLRTVVEDPLTPPIRADRERRELDRLTAIITEHEQGSRHG
jgi:integrase